MLISRTGKEKVPCYPCKNKIYYENAFNENSSQGGTEKGNIVNTGFTLKKTQKLLLDYEAIVLT